MEEDLFLRALACFFFCFPFFTFPFGLFFFDTFRFFDLFR